MMPFPWANLGPHKPGGPSPPRKPSPFINAIWRQQMKSIIEAMRKGLWEGMPFPRVYKDLNITFEPLRGPSPSPYLACELRVFEEAKRLRNRVWWREECFTKNLEVPDPEDEHFKSVETMNEVLKYVHGLSEFYWDVEFASATIFPREDPYTLSYEHKKCNIRYTTTTALAIGPSSQPENCHTLTFITLPARTNRIGRPETQPRIVELFCLVAMATYAIETLAKEGAEHVARVVVVKGQYVRRIKAVFDADWLRDLHADRNLLRGGVRLEIGPWVDWKGTAGHKGVLNHIFEEIPGFRGVQDKLADKDRTGWMKGDTSSVLEGKLRAVGQEVEGLRRKVLDRQDDPVGKLNGPGHLNAPREERSIGEDKEGVAEDHSLKDCEQAKADEALARGKGGKRARGPSDGDGDVVRKKMRLNSRTEEKENFNSCSWDEPVWYTASFG